MAVAAPVAIAMMAISAAATVASAVQQSKAMKQQARLKQLEAESARIAGIEQGNQVLRDFIERDAANNAAQGAAGFDLSGDFENIQVRLLEDAERNLRIGRSNAETRAKSAEIEANVLKSNAKGVLIGGIGKAAGQVGSSLLSFGGGGAATPQSGQFSGAPASFAPF